MNINEITLYGRLGRDPELKALPNGTSVCNFSVATDKEFKDRDGVKQTKTEWHDVVFFGKRAEAIAQYIHKGDTIYVRGSLETRSWEKDGQKHYRTEIRGDDFKFGDGNKKKENVVSTVDNSSKGRLNGASPEPLMPEYPEEEINPEDIPF